MRKSEQGRPAGQGLALSTETGVSYAVRIRGGCDGGGKGALVQTEVSGTLGCSNDQTLFHFQKPQNQPCIFDMAHADAVIRECGEVVPTLQARMGTGGNQVPIVFRQRGFGDYVQDEIAGTCKQRDGKSATDLVVAAVDCRNGTENPDVNGTLQAKPNGGMSLNLQNVVRINSMVRRLTPIECERLQGFPDGWTDIGTWHDSAGKERKTSDSARYKALGNSIALPPWKWVLGHLCAQYEREATMASLFDGIGGFPLIWEQINGEGSCLWASEIDEFSMAVTKKRFGGIEK